MLPALKVRGPDAGRERGEGGQVRRLHEDDLGEQAGGDGGGEGQDGQEDGGQAKGQSRHAVEEEQVIVFF